LYAGGKPTFVVDAYTMRLLGHLGVMSAGADYETVRRLFMENLPEDAALFNEYHALIVRHSKEFCRKRPVCPGCPLAKPCRSAE
jgi:endonuclease-3 related protein